MNETGMGEAQDDPFAGMKNREVHELRRGDVLLAWLHQRPDYCDRGRWDASIAVGGYWTSDADPWPRYYFDLERGKAEVECYLAAKGVIAPGAAWVKVEPRC